jgi:hypothetical protein
MAGTTATLSASVLKKAIDRYYNELREYQGKADYELACTTDRESSDGECGDGGARGGVGTGSYTE